LCYGDRVHRRPASITFFETSFRYIERGDDTYSQAPLR
jgi:hypothetical protein